MNINRDFDQLRAYLAWLVELECQIDELNEVKSRAFREASACGFPRQVLRDLLRMRQEGRLEEADIPSAYDGIINSRGLADNSNE